MINGIAINYIIPRRADRLQIVPSHQFSSFSPVLDLFL
jgi:hypothetical protein